MIKRILIFMVVLILGMVAVYGASILTTRDTLNGLVYYHKTIYQGPRATAASFDDWKRRSESSLWAMESMIDQEWRLMLAYPGYRYDLRMMMSRFTALGREYKEVLQVMDTAFADNPLLRRGWEELELPNLRRGVDEQNIPIGEVTSSLNRLNKNFDEGRLALKRYREFSDSAEDLNQDLVALLQRYRKELGAMDGTVQMVLERYLGGR